MADKAGLLVGDMILAVNGEDFVGASYETAAKVFFIYIFVLTAQSIDIFMARNSEKKLKFKFNRYFLRVK